MTFEFDGKKYKKAATHQKEWGNKLISKLELQGNEKILDLGCGDGFLTVELAKRVPQGFVLGIDSSQGMLEIAQNNKKDNLEFLLMDINKIDLSKKFDIIFSNATLHWVKDHYRLWQKIFTLLNDNGLVCFNFAADGNCSNLLKITRKLIKLPEYRVFFDKFEWPWFMPRLKDYKIILNNFNFSKLEIWEENADRFFPNKKALIAWIDQPSLVPFLKCIENDNAKKEFRNQAIQYMLKSTLQKDGRYFETFKRINVKIKSSKYRQVN